MAVAEAESTKPARITDPDAQLMMRVRDGDEEAFAQLVSAYQNRLIGVFYHIAATRDEAEDLAQETFLRVYRARGTYEPTAKFSTWLYRIAQNLASNSRRGAGRRKEVAYGGNESGPLGPRPAENVATEKSALMPSRMLAKAEVQDIVRLALDELGERQKMAVLLHKFEGMSYADIAESMEMSIPAVKSLLSRAREKLRSRLEAYVR
ncbi:RNA polymerase sigma factor [Stratiformator vulcanicus]|uniref:RNA polymerase sigma factor n=1 Tax=Stratiformator vulcanicus TaxID=2527980 RepID=A0A517R460_9PLAN|nr:sigma-70 family RNA polymerase sigma factor [Stratiformator vulcanicus]QDT38647.1 ECF RNA polymerase sigma-E factor [Stratiformator vulcanicus]